jgi:Pectate lyase superfamily protein
MTIFNVRDYGARGDRSQDDAPAIQAAIDAAASPPGGTVFIPAGQYILNTRLHITSGLTVQGEGYGGEDSARGSILIPTSTSGPATAIAVASREPVIFENFQVTSLVPPAPTGIPHILLDAPPGDSALNLDSTFRNVYFLQGDVGLSCRNAARWAVDRCVFNNLAYAGLVANNVDYPDQGDSAVISSFFTGSPNTAHILYQAGGGLKIVASKIINGPDSPFGIRLRLLTEQDRSTSILLINSNSIEGAGIACILLERGPSTRGNFSFVSITGNQIGAPYLGVLVPQDDPWLHSLVLSGNCLSLASPRSTAGVFQGTSVKTALVGGNTIQGPAGARAWDFGLAAALQQLSDAISIG